MTRTSALQSNHEPLHAHHRAIAQILWIRGITSRSPPRRSVARTTRFTIGIAGRGIPRPAETEA